MKTQIRSGRCWVPPEWRDPLNLRFYQRTAFVAVSGVTSAAQVRELLADHLPLLPPCDDESQDLEPVPDDASARRMARRLSKTFPARGTRELSSSGFIPRHAPGVYVWRDPRHGGQVFRVGPDGSFALVSVFRDSQVEFKSGQWSYQLTASRPW